MENLSDKAKLSVIETVASQTIEQSIDIQINLPDYCSDIRKILKCFVLPNIFACGISGDRVTADGEALIRVLYTGENNKLECYEQSVPFSRYAELSLSEGDLCVKAKSDTEYVNCRAASQRRISVAASIALHFKVTRIAQDKVYCDDDDTVETESEEISCTVPTALCGKIFEMSETAALPQSLSTVACVIKAHTSACVDTIKTVADKMLIKGEMVTDILYKTQVENPETEKYRHSMPISQIIDLDGLDENSFCDVDIDILSVCVYTKSDAEGNNRLIDISVKAQANVSAYDNRKTLVTCDGYSTEYETDSEYKNIFLRNHLFTYKETVAVRENIDLSSLCAQEITDVFVLKCSGNAAENEGRLSGKGEVPVGILFKNEQGEYGYTERTADFSFECHGAENSSKVIAIPHFTVKEASGNMSSAQNAEIRLLIDISMPVFSQCEKRVCTKLEIIEERKKPHGDCPLTVYFSQKGEKIWDIAKKYNSTCERIREDNDISGDETDDKTILLISAV